MDGIAIAWKGSVGAFEAGRLKVGGERTLPFLESERKGVRPALGMEVHDIAPENASAGMPSADAAAWASACERRGAEFIALNLASTSPDGKDASAAEAAETLRSVLRAVGVPVIVLGSGSDEKDLEVLKECAKAGFELGRKLILGSAREENYKSVAALSMAYGHGVLAQTPMDLNMAKQLNILLAETGVKPGDIIIDPLSSALGYGLEYTYSTMERIRLNALEGDEILQRPTIGYASNAWETREVGERPELGADWEIATAVAMLLAGCSMVVVRSAPAFDAVKAFLDRMAGEA